MPLPPTLTARVFNLVGGASHAPVFALRHARAHRLRVFLGETVAVLRRHCVSTVRRNDRPMRAPMEMLDWVLPELVRDMPEALKNDARREANRKVSFCRSGLTELLNRFTLRLPAGVCCCTPLLETSVVVSAQQSLTFNGACS